MQRVRLFVFALGHFCVDSYASMLAPALPFLRQRLGLSFAQLGLLNSFVQLSNLGQPILGILGYHLRGRVLILAGMALAALFTPLIGVAPRFGWLAACTLLGGLGVAAFHPRGFAVASELSGDRRAFGLALFIFGGTLALGVAPLWVTAIASGEGVRAFGQPRSGLSVLILAAIPGLLILPVISRVLPRRETAPPTAGSIRLSELRDAWAPVGSIVVVVVLRSIAGFGFASYLPLLGQERGQAPLVWGASLSIYNTAGVVGSLVLGYLADRRDRKSLVWLSLLLSVPFLLWFLVADGPSALLALGVGGALLFATNSQLIALAQRHAPANASLVSSLPGGFSWGVAGLTMPLAGLLADAVGVTTVMRVLALTPLAAAAAALLLPIGRSPRPRVLAPEASARA